MTTTTTTKISPEALADLNAKHDRMQAAWAIVAPKHDWKAPVFAHVAASEERVAEICDAVEYMTATKATARQLRDGTWSIEADGYRRGPAN
jgi:nitroimidazol reductase NimA-like FMN-containing flavoprotein (pyridoxamine 5'-phosphate oxidase superfamily)